MALASSRRTLLLAALLGVLACAAALLAWQGKMAFWTPSDRAFDPAAWAWRSEEHWAVGQTAQDLAEMLCFAAKEKPEGYEVRTVPGPRPHTYRIQVKGPRLGAGLEQEVELHHFLWDPQDYAAYVKGLQSALHLEPAAVQEGLAQNTLERLLKPLPAELERTQQEVSKALNASPASAEPHEAAAAVLSAFGLFSEAGAYTDHRRLLCRMSAHLAMASALRPGAAGPAAAFASSALLHLSGQSAAAMKAVEALRGQPGAPPAPWLNALSMCITGDYRLAGEAKSVSLAEALASFRTRGEHRTPEEAFEWIQQVGAQALPDYLQHAAYHWSLGVQVGHRVTGPALQVDLDHLRQIQEARGKRSGWGRKDWCAALNVLPGRAYDPAQHRLEVLDWGAWAQRFQAQLLDDMEHRMTFLMESFGSKPDGEAFLDAMVSQYEDLDQFPVFQVRCAKYRPGSYAGAIRRAAKLLAAHPEAVSDSNFVCLSMPKEAWVPPAALPRYGQWLSVPVPFGTAYNLGYRSREMPEWTHATLATRKPYQDMRPWDLWLTKSIVGLRFGKGHPTPEAVEELYGPIKAFAPKLYLDWMAGAYDEDSPERLKVVAQLAEIDPSEQFVLARLFLHQGREKEALEAFLRGFNEDRDRVRVSNGMRWAVAALYRQGRVGLAEEIASDCAETGSARGLMTFSLLRELQGRYKEAEAAFQDMDARYGRSDGAEAFGMYMRCASKDPRMKQRFEEELRRIFPAGIQPFDAARAPLPPRTGVTLATTPAWVEKRGLQRGAVIVAIEGRRIENQAQYLALREVGLDDELDLVVFQNGRYQPLKISVPSRRFGVNLADYRAN
ncbi:MAG: hypothetical protein HY014_17465 [Acidobacteria bacterium]|nr:hypothetical protein [Acidobacteriota bacterium]MBI3489924.1 hypothetical protein [Acidobacteriota bacterium]